MYNIGGLPLLTDAAYKTFFMDAYDQSKKNADPEFAIYEELAYVETGSEVSIKDSYLSALPKMRPMRASHPVHGGTEQGQTLVKVPYKAEATIERDLIESTRGMALLERTITGLAAEAARFKRNLIETAIDSNVILCADGATLFSNTHSFGSSGNVDNNAATAFGALGAGYYTELPNFMKMRDSNGNSIMQRPNVVLTVPELIPNADVVFNPMKLDFSVTGIPHVGQATSPKTRNAAITTATSTTAWYMFKTDLPTAKPFVIYQSSDPIIEVTSMDADAWKIDRMLHIVCSWFGVIGAGPFWLSFRGNA